MASPRTVPNGKLTIQLGLLHVNVSLGKAWADEREKGLRDVCADHTAFVNRNERCPVDDDCTLSTKVKGVELPDGKIRVLAEGEIEDIESATKSDLLAVEETRPLDELPLHLSTGCYYVRPNSDVPGSEAAFALLARTLNGTGMGLVVKWGTSSRERLCVIHAHENMVVLRTLPMGAEVREPGDKETSWESVKTDPKMVTMASKLVKSMRGKGEFKHEGYENEGLRLRSEAVERVLNGKGKATAPPAPKAPSRDLEAELTAALAAMEA
jgi:non-homologous end joining protein Ku